MRLSSTYRLQFRNGFGLDDAAGVVPYLDRLGISHVYASPLTTAVADSTHGYDICAYDAIDPAIGGTAGFERLSAALRERSMGLLLDFVPNHMAASVENPWWRSVLAEGSESPYAGFFDIDWEPKTGATPGKVLLPVLGEPYAQALHKGDLRLAANPPTGGIEVVYFDSRFPVSAESRRLVMNGTDDATAATAAISADRGRLHAVLEAQHYRLAHWRMGAYALNYRRFFDIDGLVGVRVEEPKVFDAVHGFVLDLVTNGAVNGLRIDHVDGLRDPRGYLERLATLTRMASGDADFPIYVEKILGPGESLRSDWPVAGTTGYEALNLVNGLFVDPVGEGPLTEGYAALTGEETGFPSVSAEARRFILGTTFAGERDALAHRAAGIAATRTETRDVPEGALREALSALLVSFPVYRSYVSDPPATGEDRALLSMVFDAARRTGPAEARAALDFLEQLILEDVPTDPEARELVARLQQLTGPVMAKSFEDTAFYRYQRLVALNEVGGEPDHWAVTPAQFHAAAENLQHNRPRNLIAGTTHDTKFGEDARARLDTISEMAEAWRSRAGCWLSASWPFVQHLDSGPAPEPGMVYRLLQMLAAAWPPDSDLDEESPGEDFADRIRRTMEKTVREAKLRTSWTAGDERYEAAVSGFVDALLDRERSPQLLSSLYEFLPEVMRAGALNALSQMVVRLTMPGIPDIYQGSELWQLSLVDPDNRRPVDFAERARLLDEYADAAADAVLADWRTGAIKLAVMYRILRFRRQHPTLFDAGEYLPLHVEGGAAAHVLAFARVEGARASITAVPRLASALAHRAAPHPLPGEWGNTALVLPPWLADRRLLSVTESGREIRAQRTLPLARILDALPVALVATED
ncbi:MAG: malto-oligosyltrehalose synthase [Acetobacterales bacterium]